MIKTKIIQPHQDSTYAGGDRDQEKSGREPSYMGPEENLYPFDNSERGEQRRNEGWDVIVQQRS